MSNGKKSTGDGEVAVATRTRARRQPEPVAAEAKPHYGNRPPSVQGTGGQAAQLPPQHLRPTAIIVQQGKLLDFIDGQTQRNETPEEYVRQEIAKSLVREYKYSKSDIKVEFGLKLGSKRPRADLVVFAEGQSHAEAHATVIVECKSQAIKSSDRKEGVGRLCPETPVGGSTGAPLHEKPCDGA